VDGSGERERSSLMTPVVQLVNAQHVWMRWWRKMCARQKRSMKANSSCYALLRYKRSLLTVSIRLPLHRLFERKLTRRVSRRRTRTRMRNKPRSIAFQLILLFTLAAALLLASGLGIFYSIVVRHASAEDNAVLADKLSAVSGDLRENGPEMFAEELANVRAEGHTPYWIRMLDANGRTVAETP